MRIVGVFRLEPLLLDLSFMSCLMQKLHAIAQFAYRLNEGMTISLTVLTNPRGKL